MNELSQLTEELIRFRDERDWAQFHNSKDLASAISIEAGELLEAFLWKQPEDAKLEKVKEELADVFGYCLLLASNYQLNLGAILREKMAANASKYPVDKAKGNAKKYNEL